MSSSQIWKPKEETVIIYGPRKGVMDCYFIGKEETSLMICGTDGSIKLWSVKTGNPINLILADIGLCLTCVDRSSDCQWLAQGTTNQGFQIVQVPCDSDLVI